MRVGYCSWPGLPPPPPRPIHWHLDPVTQKRRHRHWPGIRGAATSRGARRTWCRCCFWLKGRMTRRRFGSCTQSRKCARGQRLGDSVVSNRVRSRAYVPVFIIGYLGSQPGCRKRIEHGTQTMLALRHRSRWGKSKSDGAPLKSPPCSGRGAAQGGSSQTRQHSSTLQC